jgi:hypothetical protein
MRVLGVLRSEMVQSAIGSLGALQVGVDLLPALVRLKVRIAVHFIQNGQKPIHRFGDLVARLRAVGRNGTMTQGVLDVAFSNARIRSATASSPTP